MGMRFLGINYMGIDCLGKGQLRRYCLFWCPRMVGHGKESWKLPFLNLVTSGKLSCLSSYNIG